MPTQGRIIHLLGALVAGGAERAAVDLVIGLKQAGFCPEVWLLIDRQDAVGNYWRGLLEKHDIAIRTGPTTRMSLRTIHWLARGLADPQVSLVHLHLTYAERAYYLARFLHRRRYAVLRMLANMEFPGGSIGWAMRHSDVRMSVAVGKSTYDYFQGKIKGEMVCVPYGMNFHWPIYDPALRSDRLGDLGLDPDKRHFLTVGSMNGASCDQTQKAHNTLILAWQQAGLGAKGGQLNLLGTGTLKPQLEALAGDDPSIVFHGVQSGVERWLLAVDCYVMPSRWEGLPLAGIEAVGTGVPCIFSDIEPCKELGFSDAMFFPVDDVEQLASLLRNRFEKPQPKMDLDNIRQLRDRYGIDRPLEAFRQLYDNLINAV